MKLRAERRAGEMLGRLERGKPPGKKATPDVGHNSEYAKVLEDTETTRQDASRWQTIAGMEEESRGIVLSWNCLITQLQEKGMTGKAGINLLPECSETEHFLLGEKAPRKQTFPLILPQNS